MWRYGDRIVVRYRNAGRISQAMPVLVVEDSADLIAFYMPAETPMKHKVRLDGSPIERSLPYEERHAIPCKLGDRVWTAGSMLQVARPDASQGILLRWSGVDGAFQGWYVNLQAPLERTSVGFDTVDHILDVVVEPDRSWRWKDEDEFAAAQRIGRLTQEEAAKIRLEGEAAIEAVERGDWPYDADWERWRPDPAWTIPALPENWDAE